MLRGPLDTCTHFSQSFLMDFYKYSYISTHRGSDVLPTSLACVTRLRLIIRTLEVAREKHNLNFNTWRYNSGEGISRAPLNLGSCQLGDMSHMPTPNPDAVKYEWGPESLVLVACHTLASCFGGGRAATLNIRNRGSAGTTFPFLCKYRALWCYWDSLGERMNHERPLHR